MGPADDALKLTTGAGNCGIELEEGRNRQPSPDRETNIPTELKEAPPTDSAPQIAADASRDKPA